MNDKGNLYSKLQILQMSAKDKVIFSSKDDEPSSYEMPPSLPSEERRGVLLPNGELNWLCPCLGGLPYGPCGFEFREFFGCIHRIQEKEKDKEPEAENKEASKTQECFPKFTAMKECFSQFPKLYPPDDDELET